MMCDFWSKGHFQPNQRTKKEDINGFSLKPATFEVKYSYSVVYQVLKDVSLECKREVMTVLIHSLICSLNP